MRTRLVTAGFLLAILGADALAAEYAILGARLQVKDPSPDASRRKVVIQAKERPTDVGTLSDPRIAGATLQVVLSGGTPAGASYPLPAPNWETSGYGYGYRYSRPSSAPPTDPVLRAFIKKSPSGLMQMKVVLRGATNLVPPNPGSEAQIFLDVSGGDRYCTAFGGAAGGVEILDTAEQWKIAAAGAEGPCPPPGLPACFSEFAPCGSCGDGICLAHYSGSPAFVCASQSGFSAGSCASSAECTAPRECATGGGPCPPFGECVLPCTSDAYCDAELSPGFCAASTCPGVFCMVPCP
jgi:hypothetical protein